MLKDWLEKHPEMSKAALAAKLDVTEVTVWRIANHKQRPSLALAEAIEKLTEIPAWKLANQEFERRPSRSTQERAA